MFCGFVRILRDVGCVWHIILIYKALCAKYESK
jgi:hypothetical protein